MLASLTRLRPRLARSPSPPHLQDSFRRGSPRPPRPARHLPRVRYLTINYALSSIWDRIVLQGTTCSEMPATSALYLSKSHLGERKISRRMGQFSVLSDPNWVQGCKIAP